MDIDQMQQDGAQDTSQLPCDPVVDGLRAALEAVLTSEPEDIPGLDYLIVQIDRHDYEQARAALERLDRPATYRVLERLDRPGNRANLDATPDPEE